MFEKLTYWMIFLFFLTACSPDETLVPTLVFAEDIPFVESLATATGEPEIMPDEPQPTKNPPPSPSPLPTRTAPQPTPKDLNIFDADDRRIRYNGRFDFQDPKAPAFDWSATGIEFNFTGTSLAILLQDGRNSYNVIIDGRRQVLETEMGVEEYLVAENLGSGVHHFILSKRTEAYVGAAQFKGLKIVGGELQEPPPAAGRLIEFIGDSITTGYGNEGESPDCWFTPATQNADKSYAAMTAQELDAAYTLIALSGLGVIRNLRAEDAVSAETAIDFINRALGLNPFVSWPADRLIPDAVVINLGTNDYSSVPFPDDEAFIAAYVELLDVVRTRYPEAHIFALAGPLMLGPAPRVIETAVERYRVSNNDDRLTFVNIENNLESSAVDFGCDYHPNVNGHSKIAAQLTPVLAERLEW